MELMYPGKKTGQQIFDSINCGVFVKSNAIENGSILVHGENLQALKWLIEEREMDGKVDLVYIDPPFATARTFYVADSGIRTISREGEDKGDIAYEDILEGEFFIEFIRERLILLKRLLSNSGSIYLHTDYKIGHYVKLAMDEIFGAKNFRNGIARIKSNPQNFKQKRYGITKDMLLFYSKTDKPIWHEPHTPYSEAEIIKSFEKIDKKGRRYTLTPLHAPDSITKNMKYIGPFKGVLPPKGRHWATAIANLEQMDKDGLIDWSVNNVPSRILYYDQSNGKRLQDIWTEFKDPQYPIYPTEKNLDMLDLIVKTSSDEDSIVLDCFAGSGSTLQAAHQNKRRWIGIDQSQPAIEIIQKRLGDAESNLFTNVPEYELWKGQPHAS